MTSILLGALAGCAERRSAPTAARAEERGPAAPRQEERLEERARMVQEQIAGRGLRDERVLAAMRAVPRHRFVPEELQARAYDDRPLPIGEGQTISQPYIVALMAALADVRHGQRVLEVGTGSGYHGAVLGQLASEVYSVEIVEPLALRARRALEEIGVKNVQVRTGDGYRGWPERAPFDAIVVTAAPEHVPAPLKEQLAVGGRMVIPVGGAAQELVVLTRTEAGFEERRVVPVRFVPMTGEAQRGATPP